MVNKGSVTDRKVDVGKVALWLSPHAKMLSPARGGERDVIAGDFHKSKSRVENFKHVLFYFERMKKYILLMTLKLYISA